MHGGEKPARPVNVFALQYHSVCLRLNYGPSFTSVDEDHLPSGSQRPAAACVDQFSDPQAGRRDPVHDPAADGQGADGPPVRPRPADPLQPRLLS